MLTERVFRAIGYDYGDIQIGVRDPKRTYVPQEEAAPEDLPGPSMKMQL